MLLLASLRLRPMKHARHSFPARASRAPPTCGSLVLSSRKPLSETWLSCKDRRGSRRLDERDNRNFSDAIDQLVACAAAMRVLTKHSAIQDVDVACELARERSAGEANPIEALVGDAVRAASNFLVHADLPYPVWSRLGPEEKFYLKGLEVETHGERSSGVYREFARLRCVRLPALRRTEPDGARIAQNVLKQRARRVQ